MTGTTCVAAGPPVVTAAMVSAEVVKRLPTAAIGLAPRTQALVNVQTIMWVATPTPRQLPTFTLLGQNVAVTITVSAVNWTFGDGQSGTSTGPGKAYDPTGDPCTTVTCPDYYGHEYRTTGTKNVAATVAWAATFRVTGGPATPIPGTIPGRTSDADLQVVQARSILVPDPGH